MLHALQVSATPVPVWCHQSESASLPVVHFCVIVTETCVLLVLRGSFCASYCRRRRPFSIRQQRSASVPSRLVRPHHGNHSGDAWRDGKWRRSCRSEHAPRLAGMTAGLASVASLDCVLHHCAPPLCSRWHKHCTMHTPAASSQPCGTIAATCETGSPFISFVMSTLTVVDENRLAHAFLYLCLSIILVKMLNIAQNFVNHKSSFGWLLGCSHHCHGIL